MVYIYKNISSTCCCYWDLKVKQTDIIIIIMKVVKQICVKLLVKCKYKRLSKPAGLHSKFSQAPLYTNMLVKPFFYSWFHQ